LPYVGYEKLFACNITYIDAISIFFLIGAMSKSAQVGLHVWLPDAMEGPTPVSALIHAATMVTAGLYLLLKCSSIIILSTFTMKLILVVGSTTIIISSLVAATQFDIKKIIAYSTCSQLGYMMVGIGYGNFVASYYHLISHAFIKATLFLCAGAIIHSLRGEQDIRKMSGLLKYYPFYYVVMLIASLSLSGLAFFSGYYSKEPLINASLLMGNE